MLIHTTDLTQVELSSAIVRNPLLVNPDIKVMDAIVQMSGIRSSCAALRAFDHQNHELHIEARSSCVLVVENKQLIGILTERDIVRLSAQKYPLENLSLRNAMTRDVITLRESAFTDLFMAINLFQQHHVRHLPILNENNYPVGLLTHESLRQASRPVDLLRLRVAAEVMATNVIYADPNVSMLDITCQMAEHHISSIVIVEEHINTQQIPLKVAIGIVTERDVVQFRALNLDLEKCTACSVMSTPVFSVYPGDSLWIVHQMMRQHFIKRLAVIGTQGELLGIVTQTSLLQALNPLEVYKLAEVLEQKVLKLEEEKVELLENRTIELEHQVQERTAALQAKAEQERLISTLASQIRSSLDLQDILNTTVDEVQAVLDCDRVVIWQLRSDGSLCAIAQSHSTPAAQGEQQIDAFHLAGEASGISQTIPLCVVSDVHTADTANHYRTLLEALHIRATVLLPIIQGDTVWGMLEASDRQTPRQWRTDEIELLEHLATQLAIAIQQAIAYQQVQSELVERRQTEARLRESEQRLSSLAAAAPVGIFRTDPDGNCTYTNERWSYITGLSAEAALGMGWMEGLYPHDRESIAEEWYRAAHDKRPFRLEYRFQRRDGVITWVFGQAVAEYDMDGQVTGYVGTITDISDLKKAQELIIHNARHDPLTDLPNRTLLMERIELAIARSKTIEGYNYAVLFLDLDQFKVINDSLGHLVGDQLIALIAQKLKSHIRDTDLIARLGGDEFVILLEDITGDHDVIAVVEPILASCQKPLLINGYEMFTSLSIGIVIGTKAYHEASDLIRDADVAMYRAKGEGRNLYKFFDLAMHTQALERLILETDLRKAIERKEFIIHYQPIVDILDNQLVGFEALIRWKHPLRGFISPEDFIPIAEETGLIVAVDDWVISAVCQQLKIWTTQFAKYFPLRISINLSTKDLRRADLVDTIDRTLANANLDGDLLCLEVTESGLIEDIEQTVQVLQQIKQRNIRISIDDFGTGYSSLSYLHRLPADHLKIDRSFVGQMQMENRNYQLINAITTLSQQLGLTVIAEGIETQQQLQWLQQLGCQLGQGYLFSKPLTAAEVEAQYFDCGHRELAHQNWCIHCQTV